MTDITDKDRRNARQWATMMQEQRAGYPNAYTAARVILATVEPPAPTLAEELRSWAEDASYDEDRDNLLHAADRAAQMERDLAEARAEVERLNAATVAPEEKVAPDQQANTQGILAGSLPNPADVKPAEAWIVNRDGVEIVPGCKPRVGGICYRFFGGTPQAIGDEHITLIARLVPAPRVITTPDELDKLVDLSVVKPVAKSGITWQKNEDRWYSAHMPTRATAEINLPVTVLWEPGA